MPDEERVRAGLGDEDVQDDDFARSEVDDRPEDEISEEIQLREGLARLVEQRVARRITIIDKGTSYSGTLVPDLKPESLEKIMSDDNYSPAEKLDILHKMLDNPTGWIIVSDKGDATQILPQSEGMAINFAAGINRVFKDGAIITLEENDSMEGAPRPDITLAMAHVLYSMKDGNGFDYQFGYDTDRIGKAHQYAIGMAEYMGGALATARQAGEGRNALLEKIGAKNGDLRSVIVRSMAAALSS